jgi:hypothetical protein
MKRFLLSIVLLLVFHQITKTQVTWAKDIAPILYANCTSCHHDGGGGHFSLVKYEDAFSYAFSIQYKTGAHQMPPWPPDESYRKFTESRTLTDQQIQLIKDWYNAGAPAGDTTKAPAKPAYSNLPELAANIDLKMQTYTVTAQNDIYRCFVLPSGLTQDEFITAFEVIPGNGNIVHHVLAYEDTTSESTQLDANDPGPGYTNFGGIGVNGANLIGAWVPGARAMKFPTGMGIKLHKNAKVVIQVHYPQGSNGQVDSTRIRLVTTPNSNTREITMAPALHYANGGQGGLLNGPLSINPDEIKTFYNRFSLPGNYPKITIISVAPHMHLIGTKIGAYSVNAAGDTLPIIRINDYDFKWQGNYLPQKPIVITPGSRLEGWATYNNTLTNPRQPSDPPKKVTAGEATTNEMFLIYFGYTIYRQGDEDIIIDSTLLEPATPNAINDNLPDNAIFTAQLYDAVPNPANTSSVISFYLPYQSEIQLEIVDIQGKTVHTITGKTTLNKGFHNFKAETASLAAGNYFVRLRETNGTKTKQLIIAR